MRKPYLPLFLDSLLYDLQHFTLLRVASRFVFRVDQLAIGEHVEDPAAGRDQLDRLDDVSLPHSSSQTAHQLFRQTGGIRGVVSLHAKNDSDAHEKSLLIFDLDTAHPVHVSKKKPASQVWKRARLEVKVDLGSLRSSSPECSKGS